MVKVRKFQLPTAYRFSTAEGRTSLWADSAPPPGLFRVKVKAFIVAEGCDETDLIPRLINGIAAYVPLNISSDDTEPTKYYSLSAAAKGCGSLNKLSFMPI